MALSAKAWRRACRSSSAPGVSLWMHTESKPMAISPPCPVPTPPPTPPPPLPRAPPALDAGAPRLVGPGARVEPPGAPREHDRACGVVVAIGIELAHHRLAHRARHAVGHRLLHA